jgi:hypothetical protein
MFKAERKLIFIEPIAWIKGLRICVIFSAQRKQLKFESCFTQEFP